jgi:LAGLIDADG DNA endonuclease family
MKNTMNKIFIRSYRKSSKFDLELSLELQEIIVGLMLGDLFAEKRKENSNTRLQFKQSIVNKDYIDHLYSIFKEYCGSEPVIMSSFDNRPSKNKIYSSIKFSTFSLPCFNKFRELFYDNLGVKCIPVNLGNILTARSLAYWIMDDGYKTEKGFYICTDSYSLEDHNKLIIIFKNNFDLSCGVHKHTNGYRLYVHSKSKDKLLQLIKPYLIPHFNYKFNL